MFMLILVRAQSMMGDMMSRPQTLENVFYINVAELQIVKELIFRPTVSLWSDVCSDNRKRSMCAVFDKSGFYVSYCTCPSSRAPFGTSCT